MASISLVDRTKPSFKQQNLPAWTPQINASTLSPVFLLIGVIFIPIGIAALIASTSVQELILDYTDCKSVDQPGKTCASILPGPCVCKETLVLEEDFRRDVFIYYSLTNFYQNHRRYVKSRDDYQLLGNPKSVSSDCYPYDYGPDPADNNQSKPIAPCGAIANSLFNDVFNLSPRNESQQSIVLSQKDIAWPFDKSIRFRNPMADSGQVPLKTLFDGTLKPPNWPKPVYELSDLPENNGFQYEPLIVWMRTAALPTFRKLYAIIDPGYTNNFLPKGQYDITIQYNYPVQAFKGRKRLIISNTSWLGGKNNFLGLAYIIVGSICIIISALFLFIRTKYGRVSSEMIQITQTTSYSSR